MGTILSNLGGAFSAVPGYLLAALVSYCAICAAYRLFLHPLSQYPGPLFAKLSDAYNGFYAFNGDLHLTAWRNQLKYGPVVRHGPNKLVFSSIAAVQDIYKNGRTTKPKAYIALGPGLTTPTTFTAIDPHVHRSRRQLVGQAISERFMRIFEPTMVNQVDLFILQIYRAAQDSLPVNVSVRVRYLGLSIAGLLGFGHDLAMQTSEENRFMLTMLDAGALWSSVFLHWPSSRRFRLGLVTVQVFRQLRGKYLSLIQGMIQSRSTQETNAKQDLYSILAPALSAETEGIRQSELWAEANLFLPAAGDTTKTALSAVFFYLSRNSGPYESLAREIRSTFRSASEISGQTLSGCLYLRACIDEALRLSPPAAGILWREQLPGGDEQFIVDGHPIPKGTVVGVNIYTIHHNPEYFEDPFHFRPERWISDDTEPGKKKIMRDAFLPFSIGPRGCAGKAMAYLEISLVVAKTLWYFDFEPLPGELGQVGVGRPGLGYGRTRPGEFQLYDHFTASHDGPYLGFKCRDTCKDLDVGKLDK